MLTDYKSTLNLPETKFPMRANLGEREEPRIKNWEENDLYHQLLKKNAHNPKFILHEGPPFTNGDPHLGHATNHNLKDIVIRYKAMRGFYTPFALGWDCHGLPTELKALKELKTNAQTLSALELRRKCAEFSQKNIELMSEKFKRLGLMSDWKREYKTMAPDFEAAEMRALACFVEQGLVYRDLRPVIWSIPCKTALAEGEIEYHDHVSHSIYVAMQTVDDPNTFFVIWTTTPWTIPANLAIAMHPRLNYVELLHDGKKYILAEALAEKFITNVAERNGWKDVTRGAVRLGSEFEGKKYKHPFMTYKGEAGRVILADFVSAEDGVGLVHIAPGHGMEDYLAGLANKLEIYSPIDDDGKYVSDGRIPEKLVGLTTLEKNGQAKGSEANNAVIELLKESGNLIGEFAFSHQYPFCWRSQTPIIFRALQQWFIGLDRNNTRQKVLAEIDKVNWIPAQGRNRIRGSVETRPDWCISRQRSWGLPMPAFKDATGKRFIDAAVIRAVADKVMKHGSDIFFEWNCEKILEGVKLPADWPSPKDLQPETDTVDVWLDSASTHLAVLKANPDMSWPADLYLEGSDQHRGWFQSSLWVSTVVEGKAPYKNVLTHGFILDADKQKLSKSRGAQSFGDLAKKYGADVLRLWNASQDFSGDIILSDEILANISATYMTLRNTLRYQLSNLNGFDAAKSSVKPEEMWAIDRWVMVKANELVRDVTAAYESYDFAKVYQLTTRFCQATLSAVYHDCLKDRMYTCGANSIERRSAQTAMDNVFSILVRLLAPILPFTSDEAWCYRCSDSDFAPSSVHLQDWPKVQDLSAWETSAKDFDYLITLRSKTNEALEGLRKDKIIGKSLEAKLVFSGELSVPLKIYDEKELAELYIVSQVERRDSSGTLSVIAEKSTGHKCPRCWRYVSDAPEKLCQRCEKTLSS